MRKREFLLKSAASLGAAALLLMGCTTTPPSENPTTRRNNIDSGVDATMNKLYTTVQGSRELVRKARGILVFPSVYSAAFIVGGQYGEGALRVGGRTVGYYSTVTGSLGFQAGAQSKAVIYLFMTDDALRKFRNSSGWTAGADASVAVLKVGANGTIDTTTATQPVDAIVLTNAGLMAGVSVDGSKVSKIDFSK